MWSGSPRGSWCALCAVEVCVRTSMAWSSVSLLCVLLVARRFLRRFFIGAHCDDRSYWIRVVYVASVNRAPGGQMAPPVRLRRAPPSQQAGKTRDVDCHVVVLEQGDTLLVLRLRSSTLDRAHAPCLVDAEINYGNPKPLHSSPVRSFGSPPAPSHSQLTPLKPD